MDVEIKNAIKSQTNFLKISLLAVVICFIIIIIYIVLNNNTLNTIANNTANNTASKNINNFQPIYGFDDESPGTYL